MLPKISRGGGSNFSGAAANLFTVRQPQSLGERIQQGHGRSGRTDWRARKRARHTTTSGD
jgi:hypothetical protein